LGKFAIIKDVEQETRIESKMNLRLKPNPEIEGEVFDSTQRKKNENTTNEIVNWTKIDWTKKNDANESDEIEMRIEHEINRRNPDKKLKEKKIILEFSRENEKKGEKKYEWEKNHEEIEDEKIEFSLESAAENILQGGYQYSSDTMLKIMESGRKIIDVSKRASKKYSWGKKTHRRINIFDKRYECVLWCSYI